MSGDVSVSVVIATYKRPELLPEQLDVIESQNPDQIVISHTRNEKTDQFDFRGHDYVVWEERAGIHVKFLTAQHFADNETIVIFDDDCMPGKNCLDYLVPAWDDRVYVGTGFKIRDGWYTSFPGFFRRNEEPVDVDAGGQCWVMNRGVLDFVDWAEYPLDGITAADDLYFAKELNKEGVQFHVPPHKKGEMETWFQVDNLGSDEVAVSTKTGFHERRGEMIEIGHSEGAW